MLSPSSPFLITTKDCFKVRLPKPSLMLKDLLVMFLQTKRPPYLIHLPMLDASLTTAFPSPVSQAFLRFPSLAKTASLRFPNPMQLDASAILRHPFPAKTAFLRFPSPAKTASLRFPNPKTAFLSPTGLDASPAPANLRFPSPTLIYPVNLRFPSPTLMMKDALATLVTPSPPSILMAWTDSQPRRSPLIIIDRTFA